MLIPHNLNNHLIGEYPLGILDQQCQYIKFFSRQIDNLILNPYKSLLQAYIQIALLNLS